VCPNSAAIPLCGVLAAFQFSAPTAGAISELLNTLRQPLVGRNASLLDAIANLVGATAGLVFWRAQATSATDVLAD
jgi:VanZ family protein